MAWQERKQAWAQVWKEKVSALWQVRTRREKVCLVALGVLFILSPFLSMSEPTSISNAAKEPTVRVPQEKVSAESERKSTIASKHAAGQQLQAKQELQVSFAEQNPANLHDPFAPLPTATAENASSSSGEIPSMEKVMPPANLAHTPAPLPEIPAELPPPASLPEKTNATPTPNVTPEEAKPSAPTLRITGLLEGERRVLLFHKGDKAFALGEGESAQGVHLVTLEAGTAVLEVDGQTQRLAYPWGGK